VSPLFACLRSPRVPAAAAAVAKEFSPRLQRYGSDCVVLDVSGLGRLLGEPPIIGDELGRALIAASSDRLEPAVGVAPTQVAAMLLSSACPGVTVVTDDVVAALVSLRLDTLRHVVAEIHGGTLRRGVTRAATFWEASEKAFDVAQRWGLTTIGELAALPASALASRLGQVGSALQEMARGVDASPLVPDPDVPRFFERVELEWPIDGLEPLAFVLARLLEPLSASLERADRGAAAIHLDLRLVDRAMHSRVLQLPVAMRDAKVLRTLLVLDLESHPPHAAIDIVTVEVDPAPGRVIQYSLLERARPSAETLATLTARLDALVGESRCGQPVLLDSHGPDAFELRRFAPDERRPAPSAALREPVASILEGAALRRFRPPIAIRVTVERGRPRHVFVDRRGMPGGTVEQCAGPWRSSGAWWSDPSRQWNRDEWDVALSDGSVCRLFQARDSDHWFLEGVVD
jgi:protein ImuB